MAFQAPPKPVRILPGNASYYEEYQVTNLYVEKTFGSRIGTLTVTNDSTTDEIQVSYDGATLEAELKPNESISLTVGELASFYVKGTAGGDNVRIWGW